MSQRIEEIARSPEARMHIRTIAGAVLDLVSEGLRLLPSAVLRSIARDLYAETIRPWVLEQIDRALGGDGDPTDELAPETARQVAALTLPEAIAGLRAEPEPEPKPAATPAIVRPPGPVPPRLSGEHLRRPGVAGLHLRGQLLR